VSRLAGGEADQAFHDLEAASALDSDSIQADVTLIMAHLRRNEIRQGDECGRDPRKEEAGRPDHPQHEGWRAAGQLKDAAGARKAFEKALEIKPDFLPALSNLARLDIQTSSSMSRASATTTSSQRIRIVAQAYLQYAEFLAMTGGQAKDVQAVLEKGLTASPDGCRCALPWFAAGSELAIRSVPCPGPGGVGSCTGRAAVLDLLGRSQVAAGETQQALAPFGKLAARLPGSPAPLIAMADLMMGSKDIAGAEQNLRKALAVKADALEAQQRLIAILAQQQARRCGNRHCQGRSASAQGCCCRFHPRGESLAQGQTAEAVKLTKRPTSATRAPQSFPAAQRHGWRPARLRKQLR
jgi:tetratricopeptide (TPR) repeat protein